MQRALISSNVSRHSDRAQMSPNKLGPNFKYLFILFIITTNGVFAARHRFPIVGSRLRDEIEDEERNALCCVRKLKCCRRAAQEPNIKVRAVIERCPSSYKDEKMARNIKRIYNCSSSNSDSYPRCVEVMDKKETDEDDEDEIRQEVTPFADTQINVAPITNCSRKLVISMEIRNRRHVTRRNNFVIIDHAFDVATRKNQKLRNPYVIKLRQGALTQLYGMTFLNYVNSEAKEIASNKPVSNYTEGKTNTENLTSRMADFNNKIVPFIEGYCCPCQQEVEGERQCEHSTTDTITKTIVKAENGIEHPKQHASKKSVVFPHLPRSFAEIAKTHSTTTTTTVKPTTDIAIINKVPSITNQNISNFQESNNVPVAHMGIGNLNVDPQLKTETINTPHIEEVPIKLVPIYPATAAPQSDVGYLDPAEQHDFGINYPPLNSASEITFPDTNTQNYPTEYSPNHAEDQESVPYNALSNKDQSSNEAHPDDNKGEFFFSIKWNANTKHANNDDVQVLSVGLKNDTLRIVPQLSDDEAVTLEFDEPIQEGNKLDKLLNKMNSSQKNEDDEMKPEKPSDIHLESLSGYVAVTRATHDADMDNDELQRLKVVYKKFSNKITKDKKKTPRHKGKKSFNQINNQFYEYGNTDTVLQIGSVTDPNQRIVIFPSQNEIANPINQIKNDAINSEKHPFHIVEPDPATLSAFSENAILQSLLTTIPQGGSSNEYTISQQNNIDETTKSDQEDLIKSYKQKLYNHGLYVEPSTEEIASSYNPEQITNEFNNQHSSNVLPQQDNSDLIELDSDYKKGENGRGQTTDTTTNVSPYYFMLNEIGALTTTDENMQEDEEYKRDYSHKDESTTMENNDADEYFKQYFSHTDVSTLKVQQYDEDEELRNISSGEYWKLKFSNEHRQTDDQSADDDDDERKKRDIFVKYMGKIYSDSSDKADDVNDNTIELLRGVKNCASGVTRCVRFSDVWYAVYKLEEPTVENSIHLQLFEKREGFNGKPIWRDVTGGKIVHLSTSHPTFQDRSNTISIKYDFKNDKDRFALDYKNMRLLIPEVSDNKRDHVYPEMSAGASEYLIVPRNLVTAHEAKCNSAKICKQQNRGAESLNTKQPHHIWQHDHDAEKLGRRGNFFLKRYGILPKNPIRRSDPEQIHLALEPDEPHSSALNMEVNADSSTQFTSPPEAIITEVDIDSTRTTITIMSVNVANVGSQPSDFYTKVKDCSSQLPITSNNMESDSMIIPPQHQHAFKMNLKGQLPADICDCSVEVLNGNHELVTKRSVKMQKLNRCVCTWNYLCVCVGPLGRRKRSLTPFKDELYDLKPQKEVMPDTRKALSRRCLRCDLWEMFTIVMIMMLALLLLGLTKAILGLCFRPLGMCGLYILLDLPRRMSYYYEKNLHKHSVVYDKEGWPVHPMTHKRVRNISVALEFCTNMLFFFTYPNAIVILIFIKFCCPRYAAQTYENRGRHPTNVKGHHKPRKHDDRRDKVRTGFSPQADKPKKTEHKSKPPKMNVHVQKTRKVEGKSAKRTADKGKFKTVSIQIETPRKKSSKHEVRSTPVTFDHKFTQLSARKSEATNPDSKLSLKHHKVVSSSKHTTEFRPSLPCAQLVKSIKSTSHGTSPCPPCKMRYNKSDPNLHRQLSKEKYSERSSVTSYSSSTPNILETRSATTNKPSEIDFHVTSFTLLDFNIPEDEINQQSEKSRECSKTTCNESACNYRPPLMDAYGNIIDDSMLADAPTEFDTEQFPVYDLKGFLPNTKIHVQDEERTKLPPKLEEFVTRISDQITESRRTCKKKKAVAKEQRRQAALERKASKPVKRPLSEHEKLKLQMEKKAKAEEAKRRRKEALEPYKLLDRFRITEQSRHPKDVKSTSCSCLDFIDTADFPLVDTHHKVPKHGPSLSETIIRIAKGPFAMIRPERRSAVNLLRSRTIGTDSADPEYDLPDFPFKDISLPKKAPSCTEISEGTQTTETTFGLFERNVIRKRDTKDVCTCPPVTERSKFHFYQFPLVDQHVPSTPVEQPLLHTARRSYPLMASRCSSSHDPSSTRHIASFSGTRGTFHEKSMVKFSVPSSYTSSPEQRTRVVSTPRKSMPSFGLFDRTPRPQSPCPSRVCKAPSEDASSRSKRRKSASTQSLSKESCRPNSTRCDESSTSSTN